MLFTVMMCWKWLRLWLVLVLAEVMRPTQRAVLVGADGDGLIASCRLAQRHVDMEAQQWRRLARIDQIVGTVKLHQTFILNRPSKHDGRVRREQALRNSLSYFCNKFPKNSKIWHSILCKILTFPHNSKIIRSKFVIFSKIPKNSRKFKNLEEFLKI